jgi:hypothetical protein
MRITTVLIRQNQAETIKRIKKTLNHSESQTLAVDNVASADGTSPCLDLSVEDSESDGLLKEKPSKVKPCKASTCISVVNSDPLDVEAPEEEAEEELGYSFVNILSWLLMVHTLQSTWREIGQLLYMLCLSLVCPLR